MRATLRLLASVKPGRYLEAGNPTGLTGLFTHPTPRATLLYLYGSTLDKLKAFPEHSVYRQSTEAITKHRQKILESFKPAGYEEWAQRAQKKVDENPEVFMPGNSRHVLGKADGVAYVQTQVQNEDEVDQEWDGEQGTPTTEGGHGAEARVREIREMKAQKRDLGDPVKWEPEPRLDASQ